MRKITKSNAIPKTLQTAPVPTRPEEVKESIYKADDVRTQLWEDQHYKCAYCESRITKEYKDVEHYRPKSKYYWLGHDWNNLLYSCEICNRSYKKAIFPLKNEANRVTAPGSLDGEEPLIINPAFEEPANHIRFNRHIMVGITEEGRETINMFQLNDRKVLLNDREQLFELYKREQIKLKIAEKLKLSADSEETIKEINEAIQLCLQSIQQYKSPDTPYSGMLVNL